MESSREPPNEPAKAENLLSDHEIKTFLEQVDVWDQKHQDFVHRLQNLSAQKSVVLVLGKTGTGKSSLINGLVGVDLEYFKHPIERTRVVDCVNPESRERIEGKTRIGHSGKSETKIPIDVEDPQTSIMYYDCGGFEDTEGAGIEIQNALYLQRLSATLKGVKMILTVTENTIMQDKQNGILSELDQITRLFTNFDFLRSNLCLIITKGSYDTEKEDVVYRLKRLTDHQPNQTIKELVNSLIENDRIELFSVPSEYGLVKRETFEEIRKNICRVPVGCQIGQIRMEISKSGKDFVGSVFTKLQKCITNQLEKISEKVINQLCDERIQVSKCMNEIYDFIWKLMKKIPSSFDQTNAFVSHSKNEILNTMKNYANSITDIGASKTLEEHCEVFIRLVCYVEKLLQISPEEILDCACWNNEIKSLERQLRKLTKTSEELIRDTLILKGIVIDTRNIKKIVSGHQDHVIKRVEVYCFNKFFGDGNLVLQGIDLLIISPTWSIFNDMEINLSGTNQQESPPEYNIEDPILDGKPGLPGGNSGNFIGVGNEFVNISSLKLVLNGGCGGRGSDGRKGERGRPGTDGDLDRVKQRDVKCQISKELCYRPKSLIWSVLTLNGKFNEVYESQGEVGENGKDGGKGGCGGRGGRKGQKSFSIGRRMKDLEEHIVSEENDGPDGIAGDGGKGGEGGEGGKSYKATYFNEMVLPELRDKRFWISRSTSRRVLSASGSLSRGLLHVVMVSTHASAPPVLLLFTTLQLCVSSHAALVNTRWEQTPDENRFELAESGKFGKTPEEKNDLDIIDPQSNHFDCNQEKIKLNEKYYEYSSQVTVFKSLIKPIQ